MVYCVGAGSSVLISGSAAGFVAMGLEKNHDTPIESADWH